MQNRADTLTSLSRLPNIVSSFIAPLEIMYLKRTFKKATQNHCFKKERTSELGWVILYSLPIDLR